MRLLTLLRSRRLASWLLVGITVYAWVSTLVPLEWAGAAAIAKWDVEHPALAGIVALLGLHQAYSNPVFIIAVVLVTASTTACAWERSRFALRAWRARGAASEGALRRLRNSPTIVVDLPGDVGEQRALDATASAIGAMRMKVRRGGSLVDGSSGAVGLMGSPLFHWALVALFVCVGLGRLTRYEGAVRVPVGETVEDARASYMLNAGPLSGAAFTGVGIKVDRVDPALTVDGVARGATPFVSIIKDGKAIVGHWVYANNPLRYGPLLIHATDSGRAVLGTLLSTGNGGGDEPLVLFFPPGFSSTLTSSRYQLTPPGATPLTLDVAPATGSRVAVAVVGGSQGATRTVGVGQSVTLAEGLTLRVDALTAYAQLQVANDWSVPWIYAIFVAGSLGSALTVFVRPRTVRAAVLEGPGREDGADRTGPFTRLHVVVTHGKSDPAFPGRVERALRAALAPDTSMIDEEEDS